MPRICLNVLSTVEGKGKTAFDELFEQFGL